MLDVRRMKVLREVATQGSFSAAAEALNFTQSAISQHVAALERETGARLVERGARGIRLTDAGRALVAHTEAILCRIDAAEDELAAIAGLRGGRLRLACFQSAGATLVPQAVAVFHSRHPQVELGMVHAEPEEAYGLLRTGEIDLALVYDHDSVPAPVQPEVELTPLVEDSYDVILPAAPSARQAEQALALPTWPTSRGSPPRSPTAAAASPRRCAGRRGSSRAWRSRPTTRWPLRRWLPPAWASR